MAFARRRPRAVMLAIALAACSVGAMGQGPLHLMFPSDFLSLDETERRHYVLGVVDARMTALVARGDAAAGPIGECVARIGIGGIQRIVERDLIPEAGAAATPMPWLVDRALEIACR